MLSDTFFDEMLQNLGQNNARENFQQTLKFACRKTDFPLKKFMNRFAEWYAVGDVLQFFGAFHPQIFQRTLKFVFRQTNFYFKKFMKSFAE